MTADPSTTNAWAKEKVSAFSMSSLEAEMRAAQDNDIKARQGLPDSIQPAEAPTARPPAFPPSPPSPPNPPGEGFETYDGGMNTRLDKLESFADAAKDRLARIETKLDHIDKEVASVKWWIVAQIAALFLAVLGTGIAIQQMTVASFQGAAQVAKDSAPAAAATSTAPPTIIVNVPAQQSATAATPK